MKYPITLFLLALWWAIPMLGQVSVPVSITLSAPSPTCSFSRDASLSFGTVEKPGTGSGSVGINAQTGSRSSTLTVSGSSSVGQARLTGQNVATYTVSRTFPSTLSKGNDDLSYSGTWAQSTSSNSGYSSISGTSYNGTASGAGTSFTRYFRFGGTVSGIDLSDGNGTYTGTITASASCN
ncbi:MAG: hypothetical protein OXL40_03015 [Bacteroidota bacterium]|nr:hypothetical protein [Bacteroidota bacterium]